MTVALPDAATSSTRPPDPAPFAGKRALVVDDELSNRRLAARMLQRLQVTSVTLEDGDEVRGASRCLVLTDHPLLLSLSLLIP